MYTVFIKYCVFSKILKYIPDSGLSQFPLGGVSVCTQWQVKHQRRSRYGRVQKNHNILRKNTIFNEHPVSPDSTHLHTCEISDTSLVAMASFWCMAGGQAGPSSSPFHRLARIILDRDTRCSLKNVYFFTIICNPSLACLS